jgi:predicted nucleic acid-binding protein
MSRTRKTPTMPVVIDSSALVELVAQTERAPAVTQAVGDADMVAPDVVNPEVLSALRRMERIGTLTARRGVQAVDDLMDSPVRRFSTLPLLAEAWTLRANVTAAARSMSSWRGSSGARWSPPTGSSPGPPGWACP